MDSIKCQLCAQNTHEADVCPYLCTPCKLSNCDGSRKLIISGSLLNPGRKFLKCQKPNCTGFQWLDEAILEANGHAASSSSTTGCFSCGETNHWMQDCPWQFPCITEGCLGTIKVKTVSSKSKLNVGKKYLKCNSCGFFQWFNDEAMSKVVKQDKETPTGVTASTHTSVTASTPTSVTASTPIPVTATISIEAEVNNICYKISNNIVFK